MKTAIVYASYHHANTKKLLDAIAAEYEVELIDAMKVSEADLSPYELIGFASGIYWGKFHKRVLDLAGRCLPEGKKVFLVATYGNGGSYKAIEDICLSRGAEVLGSYGAKGFDTYGPFGLVGGIAKGHPDAAEVQGAVDFYRGLISG